MVALGNHKGCPYDNRVQIADATTHRGITQLTRGDCGAARLAYAIARGTIIIIRLQPEGY